MRRLMIATSTGEPKVELLCYRGLPAVRVRVSPSAKRDRVSGVLDGRLKVQVAAPPEAGRANQAVIGLLAAVLELPQGAIEIVAGLSSRDKVLAFRDIEVDVLEERLCTLLGRAAQGG